VFLDFSDGILTSSKFINIFPWSLFKCCFGVWEYVWLLAGWSKDVWSCFIWSCFEFQPSMFWAPFWLMPI
jgi:hypothetical protein